jgi:hypothetical protein
MKLFHTPGSPSARIARMAVIELGLQDRIQVEAATLRDARHVVFVRRQITVGSRIVATADGVWKRLGAP